MTNVHLAGQLQTLRQRKPILWQRWNVTPYPIDLSRNLYHSNHAANLPSRLDKVIRNRREQLPDTAFIGEKGDPYPASEKRLRLTHRCLEVLARHGCPVILSTASSLILRDIDLIRELHEDTQATIGLRVPIDLFSHGNHKTKGESPKKLLSLLERICRSGVQTGVLIESESGRPLMKRRLRRFYQIAAELSLDFIHYPALHISIKKNSSNQISDEKAPSGTATRLTEDCLTSIGNRSRKSILQLSREFNIPLLPKRFLPKDIRLENFWLAETLANHALQLELSGVKATNHWAAAKRIDNFDGDVRLWALRGELIPLTSSIPAVRTDVERLLRGERSIQIPGSTL